MSQESLPVLVPLIFLTAALLAPLFGLYKTALSYLTAMVAVIASTGFAVVGLFAVLNDPDHLIRHRFGGWPPPIGIEWVLDPLSAFIILVICVIALLVLIHAARTVRAELEGKEVAYYGVVMLLLAGFSGIVMTGDLFNLYVFLEISSLAAYALVALGDKPAPVSAFRYLVLGTVGASFYLLGLWFIYNMTGSLNMADVARIMAEVPPGYPDVYAEPATIFGISLIVVGVGVKMAIFPLHSWLPDAYTYAASTSSALIAAIGTKIGAYVLIRILLYVFKPSYFRDDLPVAEVICWLSAAGILYGSILAIAQKEMKRMLAYSSIAQIGYIGLGLGLANEWGLIGAVLHVANHAFMKACLFLVAANMRRQLGHSDISRMDNTLRYRMPWTMAAFTVAALSMIGIPPTAGFFSKWYLVLGGIDRGAAILVGVILVSSLLNAVYFFRIIERVYLRKPVAGAPAPEAEHEGEGSGQTPAIPARCEAKLSMLVPTLILATGVLLLGVFNALIVRHVLRLILPAGL